MVREYRAKVDSHHPNDGVIRRNRAVRNLLLALAITVAVVCGCTSQGTLPVDPFAPSRIAPPQTGWLNRSASGDPYYRTGQHMPAAAPTESQLVARGSRPAAPGGDWSEPGKVLDPLAPAVQSETQALPSPVDGQATLPSPTPGPGDRISILPAARAQPTANTLAGPQPASPLPATGIVEQTVSSRTSVATAGPTTEAASPERTRIVRTLQPRRTDSLAGSSTAPATDESAPNDHQSPADAQQAEPATFEEPAGGDSSGQYPVRLTSAIGPLPRGPMSASQAAQVTPSAQALQPPAPSSPSEPAVQIAPNQYGYDAEYRWLRGRLDYSQIDGRWRLRYIPIDGQTDRYGGSVRLADTSLLSAYRPGQFVEVSGRVIEMPQGNTDYAPLYQIDRILPVDR